jgi:hypothetical protein
MDIDLSVSARRGPRKYMSSLLKIYVSLPGRYSHGKSRIHEIDLAASK